MEELFLTGQGDETLDTVINKILTLQSLVPGDGGPQLGWSHLAIHCIGLNYTVNMLFWTLISKMINYYVCPEAGRKILIIKGASHLLNATTKMGATFQHEVARLSNFTGNSHQQVFSAHCKLNSLRRRIGMVRTISDTLSRNCFFNTSQTLKCTQCENMDPITPGQGINVNCSNCGALMQPFGYLIIHQEEHVNTILKIFPQHMCNELTTQEFVNLSVMFLDGINNIH